MPIEIPSDAEMKYFYYPVSAEDALWANGNITLNIPELAWLGRFPFIADNLVIEINGRIYGHTFNGPEIRILGAGSETGEIKIGFPLLHHKKLRPGQAILPVGMARGKAMPAGLPHDLPDYMYSALVASSGDRVTFFDYDYRSPGHFWKYFAKNTGMENPDQEFLWGIIILAEKLPHPIGISRETCFHLGYGDQRLPKHVNLSLTNICNLKCTICEAQQHFKSLGLVPSMLDTATALQYGSILFPYCGAVELNSYGEPTLHRDFAAILHEINKNGCFFMVQTNGTNITEDVANAVLSGKGEISFSIDATGEIFESQRVRADWEKVESNVRLLLEKRDPSRLRIAIFPTVTRKTLPGIPDLCRWAAREGIDLVNLHYYVPFENDLEEAPTPEERAELEMFLGSWIKAENPACSIRLSFREIWKGRAEATIPGKYPSSRDGGFFPMGEAISGPYATHECSSIFASVCINPSGELHPCCRTPFRLLGCAGTDGKFFELWFGREMTKLRDSLKRHSPVGAKYPECLRCINSYRIL